MWRFYRRFIVSQFARLSYWDKKIQEMYWFGIRTRKFPADFWIYQEIIFEKKPDLIIECGTKWGGSALFFAHLFDLLGKGKIISIDIRNEEQARHPRITYLKGSSLEVHDQIKPEGKVMVILDSDHHKNHVFKELKIYSEFVTSGQYLVVEDTLLARVDRKYRNRSPAEAVEEFLKINKDFTVDSSREKFQMTVSPGGFLLKK